MSEVYYKIEFNKLIVKFLKLIRGFKRIKRNSISLRVSEIKKSFYTYIIVK